MPAELNSWQQRDGFRERRIPGGIEVAIKCRSVFYTLIYVAMAAAPGAVLVTKWGTLSSQWRVGAVGATVLLLYTAAVAALNDVFIEAKAEATTVRYRPLPWLPRFTRTLARFRSAIGEISVRTTTSSSDNRTRTTRKQLLTLTDVNGRCIEFRLGPPNSSGTLFNPKLMGATVTNVIREALDPGRRQVPEVTGPPAGTTGRCPRDATELVPAAGPLDEHRCSTCHGSMVPDHVMTPILEERVRLTRDQLREISDMFSERPIVCPSCGGDMDATRLRGEAINFCFGCGAGWLDDGEQKAFTSLLTDG